MFKKKKEEQPKEPFQIYYTPGMTLQQIVDQLNEHFKECE